MSRDLILSISVGGGVVLAIAILSFAFPELGGPGVGYAVGAVYLLTGGLGFAAWKARGDAIGLRSAIGVASLIVIILVPMTLQLFVEWGESSPPLAHRLSETLPLHFQWFVPMAFMFPLGVATTRRHRLMIAGVMILPSLSVLVKWFVFHPERFSPLYTTPASLVLSTVFWFVILVALSSPLFVLGRTLKDGSPNLGQFIPQIARRD